MADYTDDVTSGMTFSAIAIYSANFNADKAFDDNTGTWWYTGIILDPASTWIKVDFGVGNLKKIEKITLKNYLNNGFNSFKVQESNNDSDWIDIYSGTAANNEDVQSFTFSNSTEYRYYRLYCVSGYSSSRVRIIEIEMMERIYFPLTITLSESLEYDIALSESVEYGITLSESGGG